MAPRLPKKIKVGLVTYPVLIEDDLHHKGDKVYGLKRGSTWDIILDPKSHPKPLMLCDTLMHEVIHALFDHYGLNDVHQLGEKEEHIVMHLSEGLLMVFKDNPKFLSYIVESMKNG